MQHYLTYAEQSLHYFTRAHEGRAPGTIESPAAWRGSDLASSESWRYELTPAQIDEIGSAAARASSMDCAIGELTAADFPLPTLAPVIAQWRDTLLQGRGFQLVSGVPVECWSRDEAERFFWCMGLHMGVPGAQNPKGELLGHVTDTGASATDPHVRLYQTASEIAFHCDAADVVGLLCVTAANSGGASRIASSVSVYNEVLRRRPELAPRLYEPFLLDVRNEDKSGKLRHLPIPPCRYADGALSTFYHSDYFRSVVRHDDVPAFTESEQELLDLYEEIACSPRFRLDMELRPGDIQWLSNHTVIHARTAYTDRSDPVAYPHSTRDLLRLWLSIK
jgi:hypothetical protein